MPVSVLYFHKEGMDSCNVQSSLIDDLESLFKRVEFKKIDINTNKELAEEYGVNDVPTIIIERDGKEMDRFNGLTQELFLKRAIQRALK